MLQTTRSFWDEETKRGRVKETKSQRDGGGSTLGWQVHTCHTGAQRDEESKRLRLKETVPQDLAYLIPDSLERNVLPWSKEHERKEKCRVLSTSVCITIYVNNRGNKKTMQTIHKPYI